MGQGQDPGDSRARSSRQLHPRESEGLWGGRGGLSEGGLVTMGEGRDSVGVGGGQQCESRGMVHHGRPRQGQGLGSVEAWALDLERLLGLFSVFCFNHEARGELVQGAVTHTAPWRTECQETTSRMVQNNHYSPGDVFGGASQHLGGPKRLHHKG